MFQNVIANKNVAECLSCVQTVYVPSGGIEQIIAVPNVPGSTSCLIQVCADPDNLPGGVSLSDLSSRPIVTINEGPVVLPHETYDLDAISPFTIPGVKLVNFGTYLVEAPKNLNQVQIIPSMADLTVYCVFTFYK
jgi:hypothetical protein